MRFPRSRYVAFCQQILVTALVVVVGLTAAGVKTLDIVPGPKPLSADGVRSAVTHEKATVDVAPVQPKVREVAVTGMNRVPTPAPGVTSPGKSDTSQAPAQARLAPRPADPVTADLPGGLTLAAVSTPQKVQGYGTVGVTWAHGVQLGEDAIQIQARTSTNGVWSDWSKLNYHDEHGPDSGTVEARSSKDRPGTDALVVGDVDQVQMRAETVSGTAPRDLKLAVIDPGTGVMKQAAPAIDTAKLASTRKAEEQASLSSQSTSVSGQSTSASSQSGASLAAMAIAPKPQIFSRAQWGANEKMRDKGSLHYGTVQTGFIHHTVNANNYSADQVPALLRGIYAYHTQSRGWSDIGYNFLVDRFGRIWEGRFGGVDKAVVGAHTLGYNEVSFAMSAIGNFDIAQPPPAIMTAFAQLFAWKLSLYNIRAMATGLRVKGKTLNAINGHRDVGQTACPGRYLYAQIPAIRVAAQQIQDRTQGGTPTPPPPPPPPPAPVVPMTSPTQAPGPAGAQPAIGFPRSTTLAGAGWPDVAFKAPNGDIRVAQTNGQLGWSARSTTKGRWPRVALSAPVGNLVGDGMNDVLVKYRNGWSRMFRGSASGNLLGTRTKRSRAFAHANLLSSAGDWNRDGRPDVFARDARTGALQLFFGRGGNRWSTPRPVNPNWAGVRSMSVPGDLTGDGIPDVVVLDYHGVVTIRPGTRALAVGAPVGARTVPGADAVGGSGDLTGDGVTDVVVRAGDGAAVLSGTGRGDFGDALGPYYGLGKLRQFSVQQLAGSGQADISGIRAGRYEVIANNGRTNMLPLSPGNLNVPGASLVLSAGDWNRDGKGDLIIRKPGGDTLVLYPGLGNGSFAPGVVMMQGWASVQALSAVGDVTGDGAPDLMGRTAAGTVIFPGNGATGFNQPVLAPASMRSFNTIGDGSWAAQAWTVAPSSTGSVVPLAASAGDLSAYDWVIGNGDVDGDGRADLIVRQKATGQLWLLPGTGSGVGPRRLLASGFGGYELGN